jgi:mono/diheme cytochrome c family protein
MKVSLNLMIVVLATITFGCKENHFKKDVVMAGGKYVTAETLNYGKSVYTEYCMPCHGVNGDGNGVSSKGMAVPPRNFKLGLIKFGNVTSGELTHDDAIARSLRVGLKGTAMLPWDLKEKQTDAVIQYVKTFSPETWFGKEKELGEKIVATKDPYGLARKTQAIEKGKKVYHGVANCQSCHRGYVGLEEFNQILVSVGDDKVTELDEDFYKIKMQDSDHGYATMPPDYTWHSVRSAKSVEELYIRLAAGVGGTSMPAWRGTIEDEEIWAVAYYVRSLMDMKDTPKRKELMNKFK